ncbi:MAG: ComF family protein [Ignavibacteria bacterium]|nr:ComF family protein [Ignavibacteria bacterium]
MLRLLYDSFLDMLAPRKCLVCESLLSEQYSHESGGLADYICGRCFDRLPPAPRPNDLLSGVAKNFQGDTLAIHSLTARIQRAEDVESDSTSVTPLLYALKYHGMQHLGRLLGQELGQLLLMLGANSYDAIIPVPIHSARERERGYNQSKHIAEGIADILHLPVETRWIRRHTYTLSQTNFSREERKQNVHRVFMIGKAKDARKCIKGSSVLLVDDILTTGATLNACAMTLLELGARRVDAATVAKA